MIKALLFLLMFVLSAWAFLLENKQKLFAQVHLSAASLLALWGELLWSMLIWLMVFSLIIIVLDMLAEYFLYIRDLKMDKEEVKREYKEQEGNPEVKQTRRQVHSEILSEQVKSNVRKSRFIIVNPTHIAIGIYLNRHQPGIPFISVLETGPRALAVRTLAEKYAIPLVRDRALARRIAARHRCYSFISLDDLDDILQILIWLEQVENAWMYEEVCLENGKYPTLRAKSKQ